MRGGFFSPAGPVTIGFCRARHMVDHTLVTWKALLAGGLGHKASTMNSPRLGALKALRAGWRFFFFFFLHFG